MGPISREEVTDEVLLMRFQGGDRGAFTSLVRRHKMPIFNFILRLVGAAPAAEDLVQDVFIRIVQNAVDFKHESKFSTWAYAIARNISIDYLRKASFQRSSSLDRAIFGASDGPTVLEATPDQHPRASVERAVIGMEIGERITASVDRLPQEQREVFLLREIANLPFREISAIIGVPENTIKSRMRYALERLQEGLVDYEDYARALR